MESLKYKKIHLVPGIIAQSQGGTGDVEKAVEESC